MELTFEVPGRPQGKARPRATVRGGRVRVYTPEETADYESRIRLCYKEAFPGVRLAGPVSLCVFAYFAVPGSYSKKKREACLANETRPTCKPDGDNILKAVADALSGIAYADDSAVVHMTIEKLYGSYGRISVRLEEVLA